MKTISLFTLILISLNSFSQKDWQLISKIELKNEPYKFILKIQPILNDISPGGTGFFISKKCILTNRHLVWNANKNDLHKSIRISAGFVGYDVAPLFGSVTINLEKGVNVFLPENFDENENDFALIKLDNSSLYDLIPNSTRPFPIELSVFSESLLNNNQFNISGFTGWKRSSRKKPKGRLYNSKAKFLSILENGEIQYKATSVRGGNSGSPIWIKRGDKYLIIGIHRRGAATLPELLGRRHGVYWTKEKILLIQSWME